MGKKYRKQSIQNLWLFCEGSKTERNYFEKLRLDKRVNNFIIKDSKKTDILGLLNEAIEFKRNRAHKEDLIFCIFDRDSNTEDTLKRVVELAKKNKITLIFSNPCFEYWILCHYEKFDNSLEPKDLKPILDKYFGSYKKGDFELYSRIKSRTEDAIKNAKMIKNKHKKPLTRRSNPYTGVYLLVELLFRKGR